MTILVTGSTGLIGVALVSSLVEHGHHVVRLVRPAAGAPTAAPSPEGRTGSVDWDPRRGTIDMAGFEEAGPFEGVVHLAGAGVADRRWSPARQELILRSRIDSTTLLVEALTQLAPRPPVLVSASAIGIYGERGDERLTESSPRGRGFLADVVDEWEAAARPATSAGIRVVNLRTGLVLASEGGVLAKQLPLFKLGLGGKLGPGTQFQSWISIGDEVAVILRALTDGRFTGPVNAVAPNPVTNAAMASALGRLLHRPTLATVPAPVLRVLLGNQMADETVLVSQRVVPGVLEANMFPFAHPNIEEALAAVIATR